MSILSTVKSLYESYTQREPSHETEKARLHRRLERAATLETAQTGTATHVSDDRPAQVSIETGRTCFRPWRHEFAPIAGFSRVMKLHNGTIISYTATVQTTHGEKSVFLDSRDDMRLLAGYTGECKIEDFVGYRIPVKYRTGSENDDKAQFMYEACDRSRAEGELVPPKSLEYKGQSSVNGC